MSNSFTTHAAQDRSEALRPIEKPSVEWIVLEKPGRDKKSPQLLDGFVPVAWRFCSHCEMLIDFCGRSLLTWAWAFCQNARDQLRLLINLLICWKTAWERPRYLWFRLTAHREIFWFCSSPSSSSSSSLPELTNSGDGYFGGDHADIPFQREVSRSRMGQRSVQSPLAALNGIIALLLKQLIQLTAVTVPLSICQKSNADLRLTFMLNNTLDGYGSTTRMVTVCLCESVRRRMIFAKSNKQFPFLIVSACSCCNDNDDDDDAIEWIMIGPCSHMTFRCLVFVCFWGRAQND